MPSTNPAGVVYGVIVIGALLAAESGRHESYLDTLLSAALAAVLYWLAHAYAGVLGRRLTHGEPLSAATLAAALVHDAPLIRGAAVPLVALVLAWIAGADAQTAVTAALWSAIASLVVFELIAGLRARSTAREVVFEVSVGLTLGMGILALKIILH